MSDSLDTLTALTGLPRDELLSLAGSVKLNQARLNGCAYHEFAPVESSANYLGHPRHYRCQHCGGEVDWHAFHWHTQGRRPKPE
jgi:hypothetical protein